MLVQHLANRVSFISQLTKSENLQKVTDGESQIDFYIYNGFLEKVKRINYAKHKKYKQAKHRKAISREFSNNIDSVHSVFRVF